MIWFRQAIIRLLQDGRAWQAAETISTLVITHAAAYGWSSHAVAFQESGGLSALYLWTGGRLSVWLTARAAKRIKESDTHERRNHHGRDTRRSRP